MTAQQTTLPNGLRIVSEYLPHAENVGIAVTIGVGSRHEGAKEGGLSHAVEHMLYKGTKTRTAFEMVAALENIGGDANAETNQDYTCYYVKLPQEETEIGVDILSDMLINPIFTKKDWEHERGVILEEISMYDDSPDDLVKERRDYQAFFNQPLGRPILGTAKQIKSYTVEEIASFKAAKYQMHNMVLSAAGNIPHKDFVALVQKYFAMVPSHTKPLSFPKAIYTGGESRIIKPDMEQFHIALGLPSVSRHSPLYPTALLYTSILGDGLFTSRLFQEVRENSGLAYSVVAENEGYDDTGILRLYAAGSVKNGDKLAGILCEQVSNMTKGVSDDELSRAKSQQRTKLRNERENPAELAKAFGRQLIYFGKHTDASTTLKSFDNITKQQLVSFAEKIVRGKLTLAALAPDLSRLRPYEKLQEILQRSR